MGFLRYFIDRSRQTPDQKRCSASPGDGVPDAVDNCPLISNPIQTDNDSDGLGNPCDNCPNDSNPDQANSDGDGKGDACDPV